MERSSQHAAFPKAADALAIRQAESSVDIALVRELFLEYAESLGFSLCFQNFDRELANLPGDYVAPDGRLFLAEYNGKVAACGALRRLDRKACEMKRLYVRPEFRGRGLGRMLAEKLIAEASRIGYRRVRLDTVEPVMKTAVGMYREMGFREIEPYCKNPIAGALYMELAF